MGILAFRLFGPLSAWGTSEAGEAMRPSARHPGRSAVFGLLAAALGLTRDEDEAHRRLAEGFALTVAAHGRRTLLRDYRTVDTVEPPGRDRRGAGFASRKEALGQGRVHTMVSRRDHVQDGLWRIFLWPRPGGGMAPVTLSEALRRPRFDLYLGRRCCPPALPLDPKVLDARGLDEALAAYPAVPDFAAGEGKPDRFTKSLGEGLGRLAGGGGMDLAWDGDFPGAPAGDGWRLVRDEPVSRSRRLFAARREAFESRDRRERAEGGA